MTCIGKLSLSSGRGAELVEAERFFLCNCFLNSIPSQSPLRVTAPP